MVSPSCQRSAVIQTLWPVLWCQLPWTADRETLTVTLTICFSLYFGFCSDLVFGPKIIHCMFMLFLCSDVRGWKMNIKENKNPTMTFLWNSIALFQLLNIFFSFSTFVFCSTKEILLSNMFKNENHSRPLPCEWLLSANRSLMAVYEWISAVIQQ